MKTTTKKLSFFIFDVFSFYFALFLSLLIRNTESFNWHLFKIHLWPFSFLLLFGLIVFYIVGLYDLRKFSRRVQRVKLFLTGIILFSGLAILFFYLLPYFDIAPKTILVIFIIIFGILIFSFREFLYKHYLQLSPLLGACIIGRGKDVEELVGCLTENPQFGYKVAHWVNDLDLEVIKSLIGNGGYETLVIPGSLKSDRDMAERIYRQLLKGVEVLSFSEFYEAIMGKISIDELEERWFLDKIRPRNGLYVAAKRVEDSVLAFIVLIITIWAWPFIALLIKISSRGPAFFLNKRVGRKEEIFTLFKFRTMSVGSDEFKKVGAEFGVVENDRRVFGIGKILRKVRADELPQVINILRGELSFVGPRADFVDFYKLLKEKIPHYQIRTVITPGLTGWAQVQDKYGSSVDEARERLAYDIYYVKNRSFVLDLLIVLKTLKTILTFVGK